MTPYCLNPNLFVNLWADVILQYLLWLLIFCLRKMSSIVFLVLLLLHIYVFYDRSYILLQFLTNADDIIHLLYFFHLTTILHYYLLLFLCHFFHIGYSTKRLIYSFISLYFLNTLFTETNSSWLIHEHLKT